MLRKNSQKSMKPIKSWVMQPKRKTMISLALLKQTHFEVVVAILLVDDHDNHHEVLIFLDLKIYSPHLDEDDEVADRLKDLNSILEISFLADERQKEHHKDVKSKRKKLQNK